MQASKIIGKLLGKTGMQISRTFLVNSCVFVVGLFINILIARYFGQESFGVYSYFFGLTNLIYIFASFGLANSVAKLTRDQIGKSLTKKIVLFVAATSFVFSLIAYFAGRVFGLNPDMKFFFWLVFAYSFGVCAFNIMGGLLRRLERFDLAINFSLYNRLFLLALTGVSILLKNFWLALVSMSIAIISLVPFETRKAELSKSAGSLAGTLKASFVFFLALISMHAMYHIDRISINYVLDFVQLGYYTGFSNFVNILRIGAFTIPFVMITKSAHYKYNLFRSARKLLLFVTPVAVIIGLTSPFFVPLLFGAEFQQIDYLLVWSLVLSCLLLVLYSLINSIYLGTENSRKKKIVLIVDAIFSVAVNFALNIVFIQQIGLAGAPVATAIVLLAKIGLNMYGLKSAKFAKTNLLGLVSAKD